MLGSNSLIEDYKQKLSEIKNSKISSELGAGSSEVTAHKDRLGRTVESQYLESSFEKGSLLAKGGKTLGQRANDQKMKRTNDHIMTD